VDREPSPPPPLLRLKSIALDCEVKMTQACFINGPKKLPIWFELN